MALEKEMNCPQCGGEGALLGKIGKREQYRCRDCGMDFSVASPKVSKGKKRMCPCGGTAFDLLGQGERGLIVKCRKCGKESNSFDLKLTNPLAGFIFKKGNFIGATVIERKSLRKAKLEMASSARHHKEVFGHKIITAGAMPYDQLWLSGREGRAKAYTARRKFKNGETESRELELFITSDADLYRQQWTPIILNLAAKKAKGIYQHDLAVKLFGYLVESGAKKYAKEFGSSTSVAWHKMFSVSDRRAVAESLTQQFEMEYGLGNYSMMVGKQKAERKARAQAQAASKKFGSGRICDLCKNLITGKINFTEIDGKIMGFCDSCKNQKNPYVEYKSPLSQHKGPWKCTECGAILKTDSKARSHKLNTGHSSFKSALKNPRKRLVHTTTDYPDGIVAIYDNGGKTADRYTVYYSANIMKPSKQTSPPLFEGVGMSADPFHPQGFGQHFEGNLGRHNGTLIRFSDLPEKAKQLVRQDLGNKNPHSYTQIGRKCLLIETSKGKCAGNYGGVYGLKDGSVYIKGFFSTVPAGAVCAIEYLDEAKAKREGLKSPTLPWRHDFTKEAVTLRRVRGGLLMKANKKPLWGNR